MKPVVCRAVADAAGKTGQELAQALERDALELAPNGYLLAALLPGDPPVACYRHEGPRRSCTVTSPAVPRLGIPSRSPDH